ALIDVFYRETSPSSAENIFHQMISVLRSFVKVKNELTGSLPGKKQIKEQEMLAYPPLIIYEDKALKVNPFYNVYIDTEEFSRYYKLASASHGDEKIKYSK